MKRFVLVMLALALPACAVVGKAEFQQQAGKRSGEFEVNYQVIYRCFVQRNPTGDGGAIFGGYGPTSEIFNELRLAEWKVGRYDAWFRLYEFHGMTDTRTRVDGWDIDPSDLRDAWADIETCATQHRNSPR